MKRVLYLIALAFILILLVAVDGCQGDVGWQADIDGQDEIEIRLAPTHEVQVNIAESFPEQIFVYIKGGLADSCTTFRELKTERSGNTINITVTTERPKDAICAQIYGFLRKM